MTDRAQWEKDLFQSYRKLLEMQQPHLVQAWDKQGMKRVSTLATTYSVWNDEQKERAAKRAQGNLLA